MAVRTPMANMILRVRQKIHDPYADGNALQVFTDQAIQDELDRRRLVVRYAPLRMEYTLQPGGVYLYTDYYSAYGDWEEDASLVDQSFNPVTPDTEDFLTGHWTFTAGRLPPILIVGHVYNFWLACALLLENWAANVALDFDFQNEKQKFTRSQKHTALLALAEQYKAQAWSGPVLATRTDTDPATSGAEDGYLTSRRFIRQDVVSGMQG